MKINQVEQLVGITKGNIRFYEKEGLLTPGRNSDNGYRDYSDADVAWLKKIKLLRMLDVPIEEILRLKSGQLTLEDAMGRHMIQLERRQANLAAAQGVCAQIKAQPAGRAGRRHGAGKHGAAGTGGDKIHERGKTG